MNVKEIMKFAVSELNCANIPSAHLDAEVLLLNALKKRNIDKSWLYINNDYPLTENEEKIFLMSLKARKKQEPIAYLINKKEFYGYDFYVDKNVLIPRPETEIIVQEAMVIIRKNKKKNSVDLLDIGTGSGCIIISVINEMANEKIINRINNAIANDISRSAIKIAKKNSKTFGLDKKINFINSALEKAIDYTAFPFSKNIIITANLPYINDKDYAKLSKNVKRFEPKVALLGGNDGLIYIRKLIKIISIIKNNFDINISAIIEADPGQISKINQLVRRDLNNFDIVIIADLSHKKRFLKISGKTS